MAGTGLFNFPGAPTGGAGAGSFLGYQNGSGGYSSTPVTAAQGAATAPAAPNANPYNSQIASQYMQGLTNQFNQANTANQNQLNQMMGIANNYGQGQIAASNQLGAQQEAQSGQNMQSRGLGNSTVMQGMDNSIQGQTQIRNAGINDQMAQLQLGVLGQNTIQQPNLSAYAQLASQPGAFSGNNGVSALLGAMSKMNYGGATVAPAK